MNRKNFSHLSKLFKPTQADEKGAKTRVEKSGRVNTDNLVFVAKKICKIIVSIIFGCATDHNTDFYSV